MKKAIIVGASSGIGRYLAKILAGKGYAVGLVARRGELYETPRENYNRRLTSRPSTYAIAVIR